MKCLKCGQEYENSKFCPECGTAASFYCTKCGKEHQQKYCPECGTPVPCLVAPQAAQEAYAPPPVQPYAPPVQPYAPPQIVINNTNANVNTNVNAGMYDSVPRKDKMTALLLCIFLGYLGVHCFYVGKVGMGILYILTMGLFGIGWLIDLILIAVGTYKDKYGRTLV